MSIYKEYMDGITQDGCSDTQLSRIKKEAAKRRSAKNRRHIAAAVTAGVMMFSATAAAAWDRDIFSLAAKWLRISEDSASENMSEAHTAYLNTDTFKDRDVQIIPRSFYTDGSAGLLFIDITRTDGKIFDCASYDVYTEDGTPYIDPETGMQETHTPQIYFDHLSVAAVYTDDNGAVNDLLPLPCRTYVLEDDDPADSFITLAVFMDSSKFHEGEETELSVYLGDLMTNKPYMKKGDNGTFWYEFNITEGIPGIWQGGISIDPKVCDRITLSPDAPSVFAAYPQYPDEDGVMRREDVSFTVDSITVSEMTMSFGVHSQRPEKMLFFDIYSAGEIFMKDGSSFAVCRDYTVPSVCAEGGNLPDIGDDTQWTCNVSVMLPEAVDIDEIAAIRLGSETFEVNS